MRGWNQRQRNRLKVQKKATSQQRERTRPMANTPPYEEGLAHGQWTDGRMAEAGFASREDCLSHQEAAIQEARLELTDLYVSNPAYAARQESYLEGLLQG